MGELKRFRVKTPKSNNPPYKKKSFTIDIIYVVDPSVYLRNNIGLYINARFIAIT